MKTLEYNLKLEVVSEGYDRQTEWFQPRIGIIPGRLAVLTMTKAHLFQRMQQFGQKRRRRGKHRRGARGGRRKNAPRRSR